MDGDGVVVVFRGAVHQAVGIPGTAVVSEVCAL